MAEKPTAAFVLTLIGGILILITGLIVAAIAAMGAATFALFGLGWLGGLVVAIGLLQLIFAIIILVGAMQIKSGEPGKVKTWSIVVLILSIICLISGGGFYIGSILSLVGAILGLTWRPPAAQQQA